MSRPDDAQQIVRILQPFLCGARRSGVQVVAKSVDELDAFECFRQRLRSVQVVAHGGEGGVIQAGQRVGGMVGAFRIGLEGVLNCVGSILVAANDTGTIGERLLREVEGLAVLTGHERVAQGQRIHAASALFRRIDQVAHGEEVIG